MQVLDNVASLFARGVGASADGEEEREREASKLYGIVRVTSYLRSAMVIWGMKDPFRYFNSSPEIIRLTVMMYVRYSL
jgi:hypothetical protein